MVVTREKVKATYQLSDQACELKTRRLDLRLIHEQNVDDLWPLVTNPLITEFLAWETHKDKETTRAVIKDLKKAKDDGSGITWVCIEHGVLCGLISLIDIKRTHRTWILNRAELSYWLSPSYQKRGLMTEACKAVVEFAFNKLRFHKIVAAHASKNILSGNVIKRLGFEYVGKERDAFHKNGIWHDLEKYELLRREWRYSVEHESAKQSLCLSGNQETIKNGSF